MSRAALAVVILSILSLASAEERSGAAVQDIDVAERLGEQVPDSLTFLNASGKQVALRDYLHHGKPVLLSLVYFDCPMLCNLVLSGITESIRKTGLDLGKDFTAISVSIDPKDSPDKAKEKQAGYFKNFDRPLTDADWSFLTGQEGNIASLAKAVGFKYAYDSQTKQYAHPAVAFVLTADGKISRYLYGIQFPPRDMKVALIEASDGRVGTSWDRILMSCYKYDPATRRYGLYVSNFIRLGGLAAFGGLASVLAVLWRREIKQGTV